MRIIRLIRLIRIVKLYKHAQGALEKKDENKDDKAKDGPKSNEVAPAEKDSKEASNNNESNDGGLKLNLQKANSNVSASAVEEEEEPEMEIPEESKVGKKLSDLTTKRVIILVLAMMFSVVLFSTSTYITENTSYQFGLEFIMAYGPNINSTGFVTAFESYKNDHKDLRTPLILLNANNKIWESSVNPDSLRVSEKEVVSVGNGDYVAIFDLTQNTRLTAGLSLAQTFFVCIVLAAGSMIFSKTATDLVIAPIE